MKQQFFTLIIFTVLLIIIGQTFARIPTPLPGTMRPEFTEPHKVLELYFKAVRRGELVVFGQTLNESMLIPIRVEYVYELNQATPRVKVYSELKHPIPVPSQKDCSASGVSVIIDNNGRIIESAAHIWVDQ